MRSPIGPTFGFAGPSLLPPPPPPLPPLPPFPPPLLLFLPELLFCCFHIANNSTVNPSESTDLLILLVHFALLSLLLSDQPTNVYPVLVIVLLGSGVSTLEVAVIESMLPTPPLGLNVTVYSYFGL